MYIVDKFKACFTLAGIEYTEIIPVYSEYVVDGHGVCEIFYLFQTKYGVIQIQWMAGKIYINWSQTALRLNPDLMKDSLSYPQRRVDHGPTYIYATTYGDCVNYLTKLKEKLSQ